VYIAFRKGTSGIKAVPEEAEAAREEKCEFIPYSLPKQVTIYNSRIFIEISYPKNLDFFTQNFLD
jgi:dihydropyrimidine dehydrogenase (NADP+)